jgi:hypothetical protein
MDQILSGKEDAMLKTTRKATVAVATLAAAAISLTAITNAQAYDPGARIPTMQEVDEAFRAGQAFCLKMGPYSRCGDELYTGWIAATDAARAFQTNYEMFFSYCKDAGFSIEMPPGITREQIEVEISPCIAFFAGQIRDFVEKWKPAAASSPRQSQAVPSPAPAIETMPAPTLVPGTPLMTSSTFAAGLADRTHLEEWLRTLGDGPYHSGAAYWLRVRSTPQKASACTSSGATSDDGFTNGCLAAKKMADPMDYRRTHEPEYKAGWNSYAAPPPLGPAKARRGP